MSCAPVIWTPHPPRAWQGHLLSVSVKASEVPGHWGKNTEWSHSAVQTKVPSLCRIGCESLSLLLSPDLEEHFQMKKTWRRATQITSVKCSNYQAVQKCNHWQILNHPLLCGEVSLTFRWLEAIHSLPPLDNFEPSENQVTKKWKWVFTWPPRETQADKYKVIVPAFPRPCLGWGRARVRMTGALHVHHLHHLLD